MKGSDNPFPSVLLLEETVPATPPAGRYRLFAQGGVIKLVDESGTVHEPGEISEIEMAALQDQINALSVTVDGKAAYSHTQTASTITDLAEAVQDIIGASLVGSGVTVSYNDAAGTVTITGLASTDSEAVRDAIGIAMVGVGSITVTVNDSADTITISSAVPVPTGQPDGKVLQTSGGALVYATPSAGGLDLEAMQDAVAAMFVDTASVTKAYDDSAGTIALTAAGGGGGGGSSLGPTAWTNYTPTLTATTTAPTLGTGGFVKGRYRFNGPCIEGLIWIYTGTGSPGAGNGIYYLSLPPGCTHNVDPATGMQVVGAAGANFASSCNGTVEIIASATDKVIVRLGNAYWGNSNNPFSTADKYIGLEFRMELATGGGLSPATPIQPRVPYVFSDQRDPLTVSAGVFKMPNATGRTLTLVSVRVDVVGPPTGAALIVDVNKNGSTIFTTSANRPTVAAGTTSANSGAIGVTSWAPGEYLTVDIDQVGSTVAGSAMTVVICAEG